MGFYKYFLLIVFSFFVFGSAFAVPGIPHQFFGSVTVNGSPADGASVVAKINGIELASTSSNNGSYGYYPKIFYVPDPNSSNEGKKIEFFLNGSKVAEQSFHNGESTQLDLFIGTAPICGDAICNADENCNSCSQDCGACPPVCGNNSCESGESCSTCSKDCGLCPPVPYCGDQLCNADENCSSCAQDCGNCIAQSFCGDSVCNADENCSTCIADCNACLPTALCGDGVCNNEETCSTCSQDCGACPPAAAPSGGGGGGGGGGDGGGGLTIALQVTGNCINKPLSVRATLNGNPVAAGTITTKHNNKITNYTTDSNGKASMTFDDLGIYEFTATKSLLNPSTKIVELVSCAGTGSSASDKNAAVNPDLCKNKDCNDRNPCTRDNCVNGVCKYAQLDGISCPVGTCRKGVCVQNTPATGTGGVTQGSTGFFGLAAGQAVGAGLIVIALVAGILLMLKKKKKK